MIANLFGARWYINGFPKSGTHFAQSFLLPLAKPMPRSSLNEHPWVGSFSDNSFSRAWLDTRKVLYRLGSVKSGYFFKAHCGWRREFETFMWYMGLCHIFVYRDFRDVAVSQAFHVTEDKDHLKHPNKKHYRDIMEHGGFEDVLIAVIKGDDQYPGVMDRWEDYAPWLNVDWVLQMPFESMNENPKACAEIILKYGLMRPAAIWELTPTFNEEMVEIVVDSMVEAANNKSLSPSYREGKTGTWKQHFSPRVKRVFKKSDKNNWLIRLGYEESEAW